MNHINLYYFLPFLFWSWTASAWNDHEKITEEALSNIPRREIVFTPLDVKTQKDLIERFQIHKSYAFPLMLREKPGERLSAFKVIYTYSAEPDWGPDQELFEPEQYPDLWQADTKYVSGRHGTASQGFRHMYFPGKFSFWNPIATFQRPMHPVGEAPARAAMFSKLSEEFFASGSEYWGYRFLGWSIHYVEDLFQPFHANQTPSKRMIRFRWKGLFPSIDIDATAETISYYHFAYEWWQEQEMKKNRSLVAALHPKDGEKTTKIIDLQDFILREIIPYSSERASALGKDCYQIFPLFDAYSNLKASDIVGRTDWASQIRHDDAEKNLIALTEEIFTRMGQGVRSQIKN
jgi:hypothetical protein